MIKCFITDSPYKEDLLDVVRAFFPSFKDDAGYGGKLEFKLESGGYQIALDGATVAHGECGDADVRILKRKQKDALYRALREQTGTELPWGSLTGIRPTRLVYELLEQGCDDAQAAARLSGLYSVSLARARLAVDITAAQEGYMARGRCLYVNIPVCATRCAYCSFVSSTLKAAAKALPEYIRILTEEIRALAAHFSPFTAVYVGGGTPSCIPLPLLDDVLSAIPECPELTVECGRPDSITPELMELLARRGAARICVNPQTLNAETLKRIGRGHTPEQFFTAYEAAKQSGLSVNCDLIAGLAGEAPDDFKNTFDTVAALRPQNITVHALSLKGGSDDRNAAADSARRSVRKSASKQEHDHCVAPCQNAAATKMADYAREAAAAAGYIPYYLYRQKRTAGGLENVGYTLPGGQCRFNIASMEETSDIIAAGAGGISKFLHGGGRIERKANPKQIDDYIQRMRNKK
ncbi:MAG: coproporphyrinogen dehydrogenase HemZ [Firmicutes bacterium]|nr:coproporphyrinogen dehydrogenase HemZ [Bacillota bacterium]